LAAETGTIFSIRALGSLEKKMIKTQMTERQIVWGGEGGRR
jgi:hypothetical protein